MCNNTYKEDNSISKTTIATQWTQSLRFSRTRGTSRRCSRDDANTNGRLQVDQAGHWVEVAHLVDSVVGSLMCEVQRNTYRRSVPSFQS